MKLCLSCKSQCDDSHLVCPQDSNPLVDYLTGQTLDDRYEVGELKGSGAMGAVFIAKHLTLDEIVAIKVLPGTAGDEDRRRFQREAQAAVRLKDHPHVVKVQDLVRRRDLTYMVQEYVDGHTLLAEMSERFAKGRTFTPREALQVLRPIADALDAAHAKSIIHRDVKPANIMVKDLDTPHSIVKLMDFGIAKFLDRSEEGELLATALTRRGEHIGTPYYMPPEQFGLNEEVGPPADVYSLGAVAYHMLSGKYLFKARNLKEWLQQIQSSSPQPLHEIITEVPEIFSQAII